jgi:hypothetical protein
VVIALASRSYQRKGPKYSMTSEPVGLWLAGVRVPSPAPCHLTRALDMETSAIFALAKYRHVEAPSAQIISDVLTEDKWTLAFNSQTVGESEEILLKNVLETDCEK